MIYLWIEDLNKEPDEFRVFNRLILSILQTNHLISFRSVFRTWIHVLFLDFGVFFGISRIFFVLFFVRFKMSKLNPRAAVLRTTGTNTMKNPQVPPYISIIIGPCVDILFVFIHISCLSHGTKYTCRCLYVYVMIVYVCVGFSSVKMVVSFFSQYYSFNRVRKHMCSAMCTIRFDSIV